MSGQHDKNERRQIRRYRIRKRVKGTADRLRLSVTRARGTSTPRWSTTSRGARWCARPAARIGPGIEGKGKTAVSRAVGALLAERAKQKNIERVAFDRGGYLYHGRVQALAEARARPDCNSRRGVARPPESNKSEFLERVINVNRCAKVVKGGRRFSFNAIVAVGIRRVASASDSVRPMKSRTPSARRASPRSARCSMVPVTRGGSIPHVVIGHFERDASCSSRPRREPA